MVTVVQQIARFLGFTTSPPRQLTGSTMGEATSSVQQAYPTGLAMYSLVRHPYVWACVKRISDDLAGLPLVAVQVDTSGGSEQTTRLPQILVDQPNSSQSWAELRAQSYADEQLTGNGYLYRPATGGVFRLHPGLTTLKANALGLPVGYGFNGDRLQLTLDEVGHAHGLSWQASEQMLLGESPIRALHDELAAAANAKQQAAIAAARGRPEWLLTPSSEDGAYNPDDANRVRELWEQQLRDGKGALFLGEPLEATALTMTLRDMEYQTLQERADFAILAVFGVPPSIIGIPAANYGTSKTDARRYWENLKPIARRWDAVLTRLFGLPGRLEIRHDFSAVEPLQVAKTEQIEQAALLIAQGAMPRAALEWCGLQDPPIAAATQPRETQMTPLSAAEPEEPQGNRRDLAEDLRAYLLESAHRYERALRRAGTRPDLELAETDALVLLLTPHIGAQRAEHTAGQIAREVAAAVREHLEVIAADGTQAGPLRGLPAFTRGSALAWVAHLEAA